MKMFIRKTQVTKSIGLLALGLMLYSFSDSSGYTFTVVNYTKPAWNIVK